MNQLGDVPIYATSGTRGLISVKLKEGKVLNTAKTTRRLRPECKSPWENLKFEFFHVCHSIPDSVGIIIYTPVGIVVHTGDFKLDYTPVRCVAD